MFQSLFSWNSPSDMIFRRDGSLRHFRVSILVFVELALGQEPYAVRSVIAPLGFNPCFRGTRPRTTITSAWLSCFKCFNPCFRGTRPRTRRLLPIRGPRSAGFQSLFSWNSPSDPEHPAPCLDDHRVSILVFVELALGRGNRIVIDDPLSAFQSLFSWNSPSDPPTTAPPW